MDRHFAVVQRQVAADDRLRDRVRLLSVSFDPEHDTPAVLAEHARLVTADPAIWTLSTGDAATIRTFASRFGVSVLRDGEASADIVHNLRTAIIGPDGRLLTVFTGNDWTPEELVAAVRNAA
jgi:protein SCO1/2